MDKIIKEIEDMSLNAWPSHKMELYDGWILRFSYFYTHRTNSVEQFGTSTLSWREKVSFCEAEYARLGSPAIFKISPLVSPDFDYLLENRNYEIQHTTNVMAASLDGADLSAPCDLVTLTDDIPDIWIESLFDLKGTINPVRNYIGLYAIHVREDFRHKGYARQICTALLKEGKKKGATKAYLQVVEGNTPARNLYESLGLHYLYTYWFRVQTHTN